MKISIRQLAEDVGVSHTTLRNAIAQLEAELGHPIGESQGKGKSTLLGLEEQRLLRAKFWDGQKSQPGNCYLDGCEAENTNALSNGTVLA